MHMRVLRLGVTLVVCVATVCFFIKANSAIEQKTSVKHDDLEIAQVEILPQEREYYAYMNLETADESLKPYILEARRQIIYSGNGWVADDADAWVVGMDGTMVEELPHFSDLYPSDWYMPAAKE